MLLSDLLTEYKASALQVLQIEGGCVRPSKLVLFLCDVLSIVRKAHADKPDEFVTSTVHKMLETRAAEAIPGLVEKYDPALVYDCWLGDKFSLQEKPTPHNFVLIPSTQPLAQALQMLHSHSVVFVDEDATSVVAQWQTAHYRELLRAPDVLRVLLEPSYRFLGHLTQQAIETRHMYVVWHEDVREQMHELQYDFALEMNGDKGVKSLAGAVKL